VAAAVPVDVVGPKTVELTIWTSEGSGAASPPAHIANELRLSPDSAWPLNPATADQSAGPVVPFGEGFALASDGVELRASRPALGAVVFPSPSPALKARKPPPVSV